jgi:DNA-binding transcriptional MerR regulator
MPRTDVVAVSNQEEVFTLDMLALRAGIHPAQVRQFVDFGLVQTIGRQDTVLLFEASIVPRLRAINRLRRDLGINLEGVAVVLDLLEKLRALQRENELLRWKL